MLEQMKQMPAPTLERPKGEAHPESYRFPDLKGRMGH